MFVWKLLFTLLLVYQGIIISVKDRYFYIIQILFALLMLIAGTYLVLRHVFVYNTLSPLMILGIVGSSIALGLLFRLRTPVTADKKRKMIHIPGQYTNLIPTFALLGTNYYLAYLKVSYHNFFLTLTPERQTLLITFTLVMGVWIVMHLCVCYRYWRSPSTPFPKK